MKRRRLVGESPYMGFGRRMAIAFSPSLNFFATDNPRQFPMRHLGFRLARPFEAVFSAATVGHPYKMCNLDLSALSFAIRRLGSKGSRERRRLLLRRSCGHSLRRTEKRRFSKSQTFFAVGAIRRGFPIRCLLFANRGSCNNRDRTTSPCAKASG